MMFPSVLLQQWTVLFNKLINWNLECLIEKFAGKYVMNNFEFQILFLCW